MLKDIVGVEVEKCSFSSQKGEMHFPFFFGGGGRKCFLMVWKPTHSTNKSIKKQESDRICFRKMNM
jgi:hypothetical protein